MAKRQEAQRQAEARENAKETASYVRTSAACQMLGVTAETLRQLAHDRLIDAYQLKNEFRYSRESIARFIRMGKV